jgi:Cu/Ag efflux protein CusF
MHHWFAHPLILPVLALLLPLSLLAAWSARRRRQALARLGLRTSLGLLLALPRRWQRLRGLCMLFGLIALGIGMAGPQWGRDWQQSAAPGRDLVVVLDCSRSMLAETPSRLERARLALLDLVDAVEKRGGHRLALVAFAGRAKVVCPLTHDYDHFRATLDAIDTLPFDPDLSPVAGQSSGTRIGLGLIEGALAHDDFQRGKIKKVDIEKNVVTITVDGKDQELTVTDETRFAGVEGIKDSALKPGAEVAFKVSRKDGKPVLLDLKLGGSRHDQGDILLVSDGDDPAHDGEWQDGIDKALALGIPVHVLGIGDPNQARPIRIGTTVLLHDDKEVRTRLEETPLHAIAEQTKGIYWPARTRAVPLGQMYLDNIVALPMREQSDDTLPLYQQRYLWFLLPAFGLLVCASLFGDRSAQPARPRGSLR